MTNAESIHPSTAPEAVQPRPARGERENAVRELLETLVLTLVIFFLIRSVAQNFRIEGISMEPNFHDGQLLIINKLAYKLGRPSRGDVVVFRYPRSLDRDFIKRVIGLPGDTVEVREGQVFINGTAIYEPYQPAIGTYTKAPVTVGPDELYVLGDNRNNSSDSHSWGTLSMNLVIGKAWVSYWPPREWEIIPHYTLDDPTKKTAHSAVPGAKLPRQAPPRTAAGAFFQGTR